MIVDCHTHIWEYPGHLSEAYVAEAQARARTVRLDFHVPPERHWKAMAGVDKAIVFGLRARHSGIVTPNEYVAEYVRQHPEKLIGFASVDPLYDDVRATLEHATGELKLRGVKLGPVYQNVHPADDRLMAVYEFCQAHRLPVIIHQAATFVRAAPLKYSLPILLEDVGVQFPDLKLVIAHLGHPWMADTLVLIRKQPNFGGHRGGPAEPETDGRGNRTAALDRRRHRGADSQPDARIPGAGVTRLHPRRQHPISPAIGEPDRARQRRASRRRHTRQPWRDCGEPICGRYSDSVGR